VGSPERRWKEKKVVSAWAKEELGRIALSDDLHISPLREDGRTHGTCTWIWSVVVDDNFFVRSYSGRTGRGIKPQCGRRQRDTNAGKEVG